MKLPRMTAAQSLTPSVPTNMVATTQTSSVTSAAGQAGSGGVTTMVNTKCLFGCGVDTLSCLHCGSNVGCWASCAGPSALGCIMRCL